METKNEHGIVAQAATVPNPKTGVNQISDAEASLLDLMVRYEISDLEQRRHRSQLIETAFKFQTTPECVEYMQGHGHVYTNIGTIQMEGSLRRDQRFISKVKMRMRFRIGKAIQKLIERMKEIAINQSYLQIFRDEGVSLYIHPASIEAPRELYKYGSCTGAIMHIERLKYDLFGLLEYQKYGCEDIMEGVSFRIKEFRLVDDAHLVAPFDFTMEDYDKCNVTLAEIIEDREEGGLVSSIFEWIRCV